MSIIIGFISVLFSAILVENAVFARGFFASRLISDRINYEAIVLYGIISTFIILFSSVIAWCIGLLFGTQPLYLQFRYAIAVICVLIVYTIGYILVNKFAEDKEVYQTVMRSAAFGTVIYGCVMLSSKNFSSLFFVIAYSLGSGAGFIMATLLLHIAREQMALLNIPKAFKGLAIVFVYIGIVSLAVYGIIGHHLT